MWKSGQVQFGGVKQFFLEERHSEKNGREKVITKSGATDNARSKKKRQAGVAKGDQLSVR